MESRSFILILVQTGGAVIITPIIGALNIL